jgi:hypothetical protein
MPEQEANLGDLLRGSMPKLGTFEDYLLRQETRQRRKKLAPLIKQFGEDWYWHNQEYSLEYRLREAQEQQEVYRSLHPIQKAYVNAKSLISLGKKFMGWLVFDRLLKRNDSRKLANTYLKSNDIFLREIVSFERDYQQAVPNLTLEQKEGVQAIRQRMLEKYEQSRDYRENQDLSNLMEPRDVRWMVRQRERQERRYGLYG